MIVNYKLSTDWMIVECLLSPITICVISLIDDNSVTEVKISCNEWKKHKDTHHCEVIIY